MRLLHVVFEFIVNYGNHRENISEIKKIQGSKGLLARVHLEIKSGYKTSAIYEQIAGEEKLYFVFIGILELSL